MREGCNRALNVPRRKSVCLYLCATSVSHHPRQSRSPLAFHCALETSMFTGSTYRENKMVAT